MDREKCKYCGGDIAIRNPTGNCDHLYYPEKVNKSLMDRELRELLIDFLAPHHQPCDCISCRKGGKIDQAITAIKALLPSEERLETILVSANESYSYNLGIAQGNLPDMFSIEHIKLAKKILDGSREKFIAKAIHKAIRGEEG